MSKIVSHVFIFQMNKRVFSVIAISCYVLRLQTERLEHANLIRRHSSYKGIGYAIPGGLFLYDPFDETSPAIRVDTWRNAFFHSVSMSENGTSDKWPDNSTIIVFRKPVVIV